MQFGERACTQPESVLAPANMSTMPLAAGRERGLPAVIAVGYLKFAAGESDSPVFIIPGVGGRVTAWADVLGDDFQPPIWKMTQPHTIVFRRGSVRHTDGI